MKISLRFLLGALEAAIVLVTVYFEPTCDLRGRLHGEATYQGRTTSYWRRTIDQWIVRHGTPEVALANTSILVAAHDGGDGPQEVTELMFFSGMVVPRPSRWERFVDVLRGGPDEQMALLRPAILDRPVGGEEVLHELAREERYHKLAERALANARVLRSVKGAAR